MTLGKELCVCCRAIHNMAWFTTFATVRIPVLDRKALGKRLVNFKARNSKK